MNTYGLQELKMAWLAAKEAGDTQAQLAILREHPDAQEALIDFIAAYHITELASSDIEEESVLPLTQRAFSRALGQVFGGEERQVAAANLRELRTMRGLSIVNAAKGLRLGIDVWKKFEDGAIELISLSESQLKRLAHFFSISTEQFGSLLNNSQPLATLNRRQTVQAARSNQQSPKKQSFAQAIKKSDMTKEEKKAWLEE